MAEVQIRQVHKRFDQAHVVRGVDVSVPDGAFVTLVGPSGCGKSTLLRMVAGIEDISDGEVQIGGRVVNDLTPTERDIAMVFQNYALYPHMTVAQNMSFALRIQRVAPAEIEARVARAADMLALQPLLQRLPRQLSGGQRQRVAMGRALVRNPAVFLFDEPLSNLDAQLRVQVRAEIKALHQRLRTTTLYVTHDQVEAMTMGDSIVVMRDGVVEQSGPPLQLYDAPANLFVAGFIGSPAMNLLPGRVEAVAAGSGRRFVSDQGLALPLDARHAAVATGPAVYGIRPEHLLPDGNGLAACVQLVEPTGQQTQVALDLGGHAVTACFYQRVAARPGEPLAVAPQPGAYHLFDAATGRRIA